MSQTRASLLASAGIYAMLSMFDVESPLPLAVTSFVIGLCSAVLWKYQVVFKDARDRNYATFFLLFRIFNAFCVQTFFQPDEYFQAQEPALALAFGSVEWQDGHQSYLRNLTWEWQNQLRSAAYPYLLSMVYKAVEAGSNVLGLEYSTKTALLVTSPSILQACFAASTDYYTWKLGELAYGEKSNASMITALLSVLNPWNWFVSTRTLANSVETALTVMGFAKWPWLTRCRQPAQLQARSEAEKLAISEDSKDSGSSTPKVDSDPTDLLRFSPLAIHGIGAACVLRPTGALIWIPAVLNLFQAYPSRLTKSFLYHASTQCILVITWSIYCDYTFYGQLTFPPYQFIRLNVFQSISEFYGTNPWHYYLTQGFPFLLSTALPFTLVGIWRCLRGKAPQSVGRIDGIIRDADLLSQFTQCIIFTIAIMSLLAHKEVRFIYPLLPLLLVVTAEPLLEFVGMRRKKAYLSPLLTTWLYIRRAILAILSICTITLALYASLVHQSGVLRTMRFLRHEHEKRVGLSAGSALNLNSTYVQREYTPVRDWKDDLTRTSIAFLTPCHSFPSRAHLIDTPPDLLLRPLSCEPPLELLPSSEERASYLDEADIFYRNPKAWFDDWERNLGNFSIMINPPAAESLLPPPPQPIGFLHPDYIVMFEALADGSEGNVNMGELLRNGKGPWKWKECWRTFNSHWHDDWRRKGDIVVYCVQQPAHTAAST